jgi:type VI secretion system secreted protein Hcp
MKLKYVLPSVVMAVTFLAPLRPAQAQVPVANSAAVFTVDIVGAVQKQFKFDTPAKRATEGLKFAFQMGKPTDAATGMPSGKRQYSPITITKAWGPSSIQMYQSFVNNETLTNVTFDFYSVDLQGKLVVTQKIILTNATISSIKRHIAVSMDNAPPDPRELEDITFTFQKIEFSDASGIAAVDAWAALR